jgi:hypothetical protein
MEAAELRIGRQAWLKATSADIDLTIFGWPSAEILIGLIMG